MGADQRTAARGIQCVVTLVPIGFAVYYGKTLGLELVLTIVMASATAGFAAAFTYVVVGTDREAHRFVALGAALTLVCTGYSAWLITAARQEAARVATAPKAPQPVRLGTDASERFGVPVTFVVDIDSREVDHPPSATDLTGDLVATPVAAYYQEGTSLILLVGKDEACPFDTVVIGPRTENAELPISVPIGPRTFATAAECSAPQTPDIALRITLPDDAPVAVRDTGAGGPARPAGP